MNSISRRSFVKSTFLASASIATFQGGRNPLFADDPPKRKMTINLVTGAIGVQANQNQAIRLAAHHGFESVEARGNELARLSDEELQALTERMAKKGVVFGAAGMPVNFRGKDDDFREGIREFPEVCKALQKVGVDRISTWLSPSHNELTYMENFRSHTKRLREVAAICKDHGLRFGMEYVGTQSLLVRNHYPFIHTLAETQDLIDAIGTGNCGYVLDSWHWWTAGDSLDEILALKNEDVVAVDLNDAPMGIPKADQQDNRRELPAATGVIDVKSFLDTLVKIGYDGPVRAEPFNQPLNAMNNLDACAATIQAMKKAFAMIEG